MSKGLWYGPADIYKIQCLRIISKYSGKEIELCEKLTPENLSVPKRSVPVYCEGDETFFESNAIEFYLANEQLRGNQNQASVAQWCNYSDIVLLPPVGTLVFPCLGLMQMNKSENEKARNVINDEMNFINKFLLSRTVFGGKRISQADITLFSVLIMLHEMILDKKARRLFININRWFLIIANQGNVKNSRKNKILCYSSCV